MNISSLQTSESWLKKATARLKNAGILTARLDSLIILEDATGKNRGWLLAHPEFLLPVTVLNILEKGVARRQSHEPLAYIRGKSEFYGREFMVTAATLQPRPESETMIELLRKLVAKKSKINIHDQNLQNPHLLEDSLLTYEEKTDLAIVDVGTGCGCLAITAKLEFPKAVVIATDIDSACIKIAKQNAKKFGADIGFYQGDLLQPLPPSTFHLPTSILMANLPYVPDHHSINEAAKFEPELAIFGGHDGLDLYRKMFGQFRKLKTLPFYVITESLPFQHDKMQEIAKVSQYRLLRTNNFIQCFKQQI